MESSVLTTVILPISLGLIMLGMGLSLSPRDFRNILSSPRAAIIGIIAQLVLLPALAFSVAHLFGMTPLLAVGLVVVALCPGGVTSNLLTFIARGDVALSVSLTAVSSMISPFVIPLVLGFAFEHFGASREVAINLPILETIGKLLGITVVPVLIGMVIRARFPKFAARSEAGFRIASTLVLLAIIVGIIKNNWDNIGPYFRATGGPVIVLNIAAMILGVALALAARLASRQVLTIGIEVGIQNGTTALVVALTILEIPETSLPPAIYSLVMFGTGALYIGLAKLLERP